MVEDIKIAPDWLKKLSQITSDVEQWKAYVIEDKKEMNKNLLFILGQIADIRKEMDNLKRDLRNFYIVYFVMILIIVLLIVFTSSSVRKSSVDEMQDKAGSSQITR